MRRFRSIAAATVREICSSPLYTLVACGAAVVAILAPVLHCHQFGEASRMAREASFSAILTGSLACAMFCTAGSIRREIASGTAEMALAHSVSRTGFFLAKTFGGALSSLLMWLTLVPVSVIVVNGAEIGGVVAAEKGDVASMWGPSLVAAVSSVLVPMVAAAFLNRFRAVRFPLAVARLMPVCAIVFAAYRFDFSLVARYSPAYVALAIPALVFSAASAAFAVRLRGNLAFAAVCAVFAASLPALGNYCLSNALSRGGSVPWGYAGLCILAAVPPTLFFLVVGAAAAKRLEGREE